MESYNDIVVRRWIKEDPKAKCRNVTFQVTDDCCLKCSYCYQTHKGHRFMSKETAFQIVDLLFKMYDEDKEDAFINHHTKGIILDFIGGEPFMNIEVIEATLEYFLNKCYEKDHIWLTNCRASMSSNGVMYFDPKVQAFLNKYYRFVSLNITIDGPKEIHDLCRVDYDGNGSFERAAAAWEDWLHKTNTRQVNTKVTIAPENLDKVDTIFDFFLEKGCIEINANPVFEHKWTPEEASLYYKKLIILADKLLANNATSNLFTERIGQPMLMSEDNNWCGGTGAMLAFDPEGKAYPCLRYMESSLGTDREPIIIGDTTGIYNTPETRKLYDSLNAVTRSSQSTEECMTCHIASGCAWCSAWNYQETGSYNKRSTNICWMHRARTLANVYYWNRYYQLHKSHKCKPLYLSRDIARKIITDEEYDKLYILSTRK